MGRLDELNEIADALMDAEGAEGRRREERSMRRTFSTYGAKMRQANREAVATVVALAVIVAVWLVGGIGLAGCGIEVFSTPIWIIGGTIGPWVAAVVCAVVLARCVFADFSLDDDAEAVSDAASAGATGAEGEEARRG